MISKNAELIQRSHLLVVYTTVVQVTSHCLVCHWRSHSTLNNAWLHHKAVAHDPTPLHIIWYYVLYNECSTVGPPLSKHLYTELCWNTLIEHTPVMKCSVITTFWVNIIEIWVLCSFDSLLWVTVIVTVLSEYFNF